MNWVSVMTSHTVNVPVSSVIQWVNIILTVTARIYDALVVMAQDFRKGMTLVDGHCNFGSIEGDGAAAMRYTEARLQKVTQEVFSEILKRTL